MPAVADVLRRYGREDLDPFGAAPLPRHRRALGALLAGRTEPLGGPLDHGDACGREPSGYHACRHRCGPTCPDHDPAAWLAERRQARLPVSDWHGVLTVPHAWRGLVRRPQQDLDAI
jgi:hypothetical protein